MLNELLSLGLTQNEAKVYQSLIKLGETAVGGIINDLKVHRQIAYNALEVLEKRKMIIKTNKNGVAHYRIADPDIIVEEIEKQELMAKRLAQSIKKEMKKVNREQQINIYNGQAGAQRYYLQAFKKATIGSTIYVLGATAMRHAEIMGKEFIKGEYTRLKTERKIVSKLIMSDSFREEDAEFNKISNASLRETRFLPYQTMNPVQTIIWEHSVCFFSTGADIFIIEIVNKEFRDSYMEHFNFLWKIAKK